MEKSPPLWLSTLPSTPGRRCPDGPPTELLPGQYKRVHDPIRGTTEWWLRPPEGRMGRLVDHTVIEHEDGTITAHPSVLIHQPDGWHGFLVRGCWLTMTEKPHEAASLLQTERHTRRHSGRTLPIRWKRFYAWLSLGAVRGNGEDRQTRNRGVSGAKPRVASADPRTSNLPENR